MYIFHKNISQNNLHLFKHIFVIFLLKMQNFSYLIYVQLGSEISYKVVVKNEEIIL
jgi:hypothetical protein